MVYKSKLLSSGGAKGTRFRRRMCVGLGWAMTPAARLFSPVCVCVCSRKKKNSFSQVFEMSLVHLKAIWDLHRSVACRSHSPWFGKTQFDAPCDAAVAEHCPCARARSFSLYIYILCLPALCKVNLICGVAIKFFAFPSAVSGFRALRCHFSLFDSRIRFSCAHCTLHTATVCVWALYPCMHRDGECKSGDCACVRVAHGSIRMWSKPKPWGKN